MSSVYQDGGTGQSSLPFGSVICAISSSAGVAKGLYIAESFTVNRNNFRVERTNEIGEPNAQYFAPDFVPFNSTLQLATTASAMPTGGDVLKATVSGSVAETFIIQNVGQPFAQRDFRKVNVDGFRTVTGS